MAPLEVSEAKVEESTAPEDIAVTGAEAEDSEAQKERCTALMREGRKALATSAWADAVRVLGEACELSAALHPDTHDPAKFQPHFLYGRALLELARLEPGVLSAAVEGAADLLEEDEQTEEDEEMEDGLCKEDKDKAAAVPAPDTPDAPAPDASADKPSETDAEKEEEEELSEEARAELHEMVEEAFEENAEALEAEKPSDETEPKEGQEAATKADPEPTVEEPEEGQSSETPAEGDEAQTEGEGPKESEDPEKEDEEEEEPSNLQLAWEILEVARVIAEFQQGEDWRIKEMEARELLGEVMLEDEKYEDAVAELRRVLDLQAKILTPDDRRIAETLNYEFAEAAEAFKSAVKVVETRKEALGAKAAEEGLSDADKEAIAAELKDLDELLPELRNKVEDSEGSAKSLSEKMAEAKAATEMLATTIGFGKEASAEEKEATSDIGHLVRKSIKRKEDEEAKDAIAEAPANGDAKKPRLHDNPQPADSTDTSL